MDLKSQKRELMNMEFDAKHQRQSEMVEFINKFMYERAGSTVEIEEAKAKPKFVKTVYKPVPL